MKLKFWQKDDSPKDETTLQINIGEGYIKELYVKAQSKEKALDAMKQLKELAKE